MCDAPWMSWIASSGPSIVSSIFADDERAWPSETVHGSDLFPGAIDAGTAAESEKTRSPATSSPFVPSSTKVCVAEPSIAVRSQVTVIPLLGGFVPGVTATLRSVEPPAVSDDGVAEPVPVGEVGGTTEQSCAGDAEFRGAGVPSAKSAPLSSVSVQPEAARKAAAVADVVGPADEPSQKVAPSRPTRSTTGASCASEHGVVEPLQPRGVVELTSATLPPPAAMLIGVASVMSGAGSKA